jgi:starch phosphorylase
MLHAFLPRIIPGALQVLTELALDLHWTWSHTGDAIWRTVSPDIWERTKNPWIILQDISQKRLEQLAGDERFMVELRYLVAKRAQYLATSGWYGRQQGDAGIKGMAYFSMECGLGEGLPLYAGGLGILAGDVLKTASDLGVPVVGVSLLYQRGYFRQMLDTSGRQQEVYAYNDPSSLPIQPVLAASGGWLHVPLELPGRMLQLRVWQACVGRVVLYLLDSNDPLNSPTDRGITSDLYGGGVELRLMQEMVLGLGGWRLLEALGLDVEVCHLNEGHAAFVVLERARSCMAQHSMSFWEALWATRAGNVFTTHTPVAAGFDVFVPALLTMYFCDYLGQLGISLADLLALGRQDPQEAQEPFNMVYLAMRGCAIANGVSRLHGTVSRQLFSPLYPRWPTHEVPVGYITNGVHAPSWDSPWADGLWTYACGKERWRGTVDPLVKTIQALSDTELWACRARERQDLVRYARQRLARQRRQRGARPDLVEQAAHILDPNVLTLGFARRFTAYKRPNLLLYDAARLCRLLTNVESPVQLLVAGKAHPEDTEGKRLVQAWVDFIAHPAVHGRAVFLEDYDMTLAQELVQGVDVWINTPRRPWEACGTSGMKVLVNGGLNLSELDGWWAEAYSPDVGWALGDGCEHTEPGWDAREAEALYAILENDIVPLFYARDVHGIPRAWVARIRASLARLAPHFSSNRMLCEYIECVYEPAAAAFRRRRAESAQLARALHVWHSTLETHWHDLRFGALEVRQEGDQWVFRVHVYCGAVSPQWVRVELYADPIGDEAPLRTVMAQGTQIPGACNGYVYQATVSAARPAWHYTPRIIPDHPEARVPMEAASIVWQR